MGLLTPFSGYPVQAQALNSGKKKKKKINVIIINLKFWIAQVQCATHKHKFHADTKPKRQKRSQNLKLGGSFTVSCM